MKSGHLPLRGSRDLIPRVRRAVLAGADGRRPRRWLHGMRLATNISRQLAEPVFDGGGPMTLDYSNSRPSAGASTRDDPVTATDLPHSRPLTNAAFGTAPGSSNGSAAERTAHEWDELMRSVKTRLAQAVTAIPADGAVASGDQTSDRVRAGVLECVQTLDAVHAMLLHDMDRCQHLEKQVSEAQEALARTLVELAGTKAGERRARHLALHDGLTSLPNRRYFREHLTEALARRAPELPALAVLYLDLDDFKPINDAHGHDVGDKLLRIVAARLVRTVRSADMVSRLGGDEFACLIEGPLDSEQFVQLARKLYEAVSAPLTIGTLELTVRPSIGVAVYPTDGTTAEALLDAADAAMYRAKRTHSGHALFDQHVDA